MSISLIYVQNVILGTLYLIFVKMACCCDFHACDVQWNAFRALRDSFRTSWQNIEAQQGLHCPTNQKHRHTERMIKRFDWTQMSALGFILWVLLFCQTLYHCPPTSVWTQTAALLRQKTSLHVLTGYTQVWESHIHQNSDFVWYVNVGTVQGSTKSQW